MGSAFFIVLNDPEPGFDTFVNGKALAEADEPLAQIAANLGLPAFEKYFSMSSDAQAGLTEEFELDESLPDLSEKWYDVDEGLNWVNQVRDFVRSNPNSLKQADAVLADLAEYEKVLQQAKTINAKWHLSVDY